MSLPRNTPELFNNTMAQFEKIKYKKKLIEKTKLKNDLLILLDKDLTDGKKDDVCDALMFIVDEIGDYALVKNTIDKIINTKGVSQTMLGVVYARAAKAAILNKDPSVPIKKIEIYYNLAVTYKFEKISPVVHWTLGEYYFKNNKHKEAIVHFDKLILEDDFNCKIPGYYYGGVCLHTLNKLVLSQQYYEKCVALYKSGQVTSSKYHEMISNSAHNCAKLLDNYDGDITSDPEKALHYYRVAARLNNSHSLHDLGYKYDLGEDVLVDKEKAIRFYRQAVRYGRAYSNLNLFILLNETNQDSSKPLKILKKMKDDNLVCHHLGMFYLRKYQSEMAKYESAIDANKSPTVIEYAKLAFEYTTLAAKLGSASSEFNLGVIYHLGIGTEKNESLAEQIYLRVRDKGLPGISRNLANLYRNKLLEHKDDKTTVEEVDFLREKDVKEPSLFGEFKKAYYESELLEQCLKINNKIVSTAKDNEISYQEKISSILAHDVESLNLVNIVTLIHRLGVLTEKSLNCRSFHNAQLPRIFQFIHEADKKLDLNLFTEMQIANLIEGVSKLYLQPQVNEIGKFIKKLYLEALRLLDRFDTKAISTIIYSATRLDIENTFLVDIIPQLIQRLLDKKDDMDLYGFAKYLYATAIFDNTKKDLINEKIISSLLEFSFRIFKNNANAKIKQQNSEQEAIIIRQLYMGTFYFSKKYSHLVVDSQSESLNHWKGQLLGVNPRCNSSDLQYEVTLFIKQYFPECHEEHIINILPVDAFLKLSEQDGFILQVDGPSHFLHASEGTPIPTQKTRFRNAFLRFDYPLIYVSYYEWENLKSDKDRIDYISALTKKINIKVEEKWITQRNYPKTLFSGKELKSPRTPNSAPARLSFQ